MVEKADSVSGRSILGVIAGLTVVVVAGVGYFLGSLDPARTTTFWGFTFPQTPYTMAIFGVGFALSSFLVLYILVRVLSPSGPRNDVE